MKFRFSLQLKLLFGVMMVNVLIFSFLTYFTVKRQREIYQLAFRNLATTLARSLDASIKSHADLENIPELQSNIYKIMWLDPDIVRINIILPAPDDLKVVASNDVSLVGEISGPEIEKSYLEGLILNKTSTESDGTRVLIVVAPVHIGGQRVGAYEITLSLEPLERAILRTQKEFVLIATASIAIFIAFLFILLRMTVIKPIFELKKGVEIIEKGNLDYGIKKTGDDEIGDLAENFNKMTKKLKVSYSRLEGKVTERTLQLNEKVEELEDIKAGLEIKVRARTRELEGLAKDLDRQVKERTKELNERIGELEMFQKLTIGRELKMVELKNEIKRLKKEEKRSKKKTVDF